MSFPDDARGEKEMDSSVRNFLLVLVGLFVGWFVLRWVVGMVLGIFFGIVVPLAIVGGIVYCGYLVFGRKALGGGRRTLP